MLKNMLPPGDYRITTWGHFSLAAYPTTRGNALLVDMAGKSSFEDLNKTIERFFPAHVYLAVHDYYYPPSWEHVQKEIEKIRARKPSTSVFILGNIRNAPQFLEDRYNGLPNFQFNFSREGHVSELARRLKRHVQEKFRV